MQTRRMKPVTVLVGTAFAASFAAAAVADVQDNPFGLTDLESGYDLLARGEGEGKCGEGKCGDDKNKDRSKDKDKDKDAEGKCGEGKCGEGKCGEGKCGEGKCGGSA